MGTPVHLSACALPKRQCRLAMFVSSLVPDWPLSLAHTKALLSRSQLLV